MAYVDPTAGEARETLNASGLATEFSVVNGVTPGTVAASKALIVSSGKDLASLRHLTLTGNLVMGSTTLSAADLAQVDGITAGTAAASKALVTDADVKLAGVRCVTEAQTSAYTITAADSGKVLTNRGAAGSVTFTLPTVAAGFTGVDVTIMAVVAAQTVIIAAQTAGQIVTFNDAAANSITIGTTNEIIGAAFRCVCDGTSWLVMPLLNEGQTVTVAT